jgi:hypothetical protein
MRKTKMEELKSISAKAVAWVDDNPRKTLVLGSAAVIVLAVLGVVF